MNILLAAFACNLTRGLGDMVVLEARNHGLPVVHLKLGGPPTLVHESCGYAIDPADRNAAKVVRELGDASIDLLQDSKRRPLAQAPRVRCHDFSRREKVTRIYGLAS